MEREQECAGCRELKEQLAKALERIDQLEKELEKLKVPPKDSGNSSTPPSQDRNRQHYPKREASGKGSGGQKGHPGHFHTLSDSPDKVIECSLPEQCPHCGCEELNVLEKSLAAIQVVDIPEIKPEVTEYWRQEGQCCSCGKRVKSPLPAGVKGPVSIGVRARSLAVYLKNMHALSDKRVVSLFLDWFGLKISEGWVEKTLTEKAESLTPTYKAIRESVKTSPVEGSDETGVRINGKGGYIWIFQNPRHVYFKTAFSRAFKVVEETLGASFKGTHVSDRYGGQLKLESNYKQYCLAHIIRECRYLEQTSGCAFATTLKTALVEAMYFRREQGETYNPQECRDTIHYAENKLAACFAHPPPDEDAYKKSRTLFKSLKDKQDCLLRFLHDPQVPPTNNDSERPLRHVALLRKVFGGFRTLEGAQRYDVFLSVIQSAKRQGLNVLHVLQGKTQLAFS